MKRAVILLVVLSAGAFLLSACSLGDLPLGLPWGPGATGGDVTQEASQVWIGLTPTVPTRAPTQKPSNTPQPSATLTSTNEAVKTTTEVSPEDTQEPTKTPEPTITPTLENTQEPTETSTPSSVSEQGVSQAPTRKPTLTITVTTTRKPTLTKTLTATRKPTLTHTVAPTRKPTYTPTVTRTATFTSTITPTKTSTPTKSPTSVYVIDPKSALGDPDWSDPMDDGNNWPGSADLYTDIYFGDGKLSLVGVSEAVGWRVAKTEIYNDFYTEMLVSSGDCKAGDAYGIIFRVPDLEDPDAGYLFNVNCDGAYALKRWNGSIGSGMMLPMIKWTYTDALYDGANQTNRLGVMAVGRRISLYINGIRVNEVYDSNYRDGYIGIFVNRYKTEGYTIHVDELSVWRNP